MSKMAQSENPKKFVVFVFDHVAPAQTIDSAIRRGDHYGVRSIDFCPKKRKEFYLAKFKLGFPEKVLRTGVRQRVAGRLLPVQVYESDM